MREMFLVLGHSTTGCLCVLKYSPIEIAKSPENPGDKEYRVTSYPFVYAKNTTDLGTPIGPHVPYNYGV